MVCVMFIYSHGTHHKIGHDADKDMDAVMAALYSRFVKMKRIFVKQ